MIPRSISIEGFDSMIRESMADTEAKFFVPGRGYKKEFIEVKDHPVTPAEFWKELERFKQMDGGCPGECGLGSPWRPQVFLVSCSRFSTACAGYEIHTTSSKDQVSSTGRVPSMCKLWEAWESRKRMPIPVFRKVLIDADLSRARNHSSALFHQSMLAHLPNYGEVTSSVLGDIYADVSMLVRSRRNQPLSRNELEAALRNRIRCDSFHPFSRCAYIPPSVTWKQTRTRPRFDSNGNKFFAGDAPSYPPLDMWNKHLLGQLRDERYGNCESRDKTHLTEWQNTAVFPQH